MATGSPRSNSFASTELWVTNGVVASAATVASPVTVLPASMTGALMSATAGRFNKLARAITITRSSSAGAYSLSPIVVTGNRDGVKYSESLTPANINGGDFLTTVGVFKEVTSIVFPAQANTAGAFTIGGGDIGLQHNAEAFVAIELLAAGVANLQFGNTPPAQTDAKTCAANQVYQIGFTRLLTNPALANPTTVGVCLYS